MKRSISSGSYSVLSSSLSSSSSSSLKLSSMTFLPLLFLLVLKTMSYFLQEVMPMDRFLM
jgi:hypothetical protein